jgi:hypothetical protein
MPQPRSDSFRSRAALQLEDFSCALKTWFCKRPKNDATGDYSRKVCVSTRVIAGTLTLNAIAAILIGRQPPRSTENYRRLFAHLELFPDGSLNRSDLKGDHRPLC